MTIQSLNDLTMLIKKLIILQETASENLVKITILLQIALEDNFLNHPAYVIYHYIFSILDISENSLCFHDEIISHLIKAERILDDNMKLH